MKVRRQMSNSGGLPWGGRVDGCGTEPTLPNLSLSETFSSGMGFGV